MRKEIKSNPHAKEIADVIYKQINTLDFWARARWGVKQVVVLNLAEQKPGIRFMGISGNSIKRKAKLDIQLNSNDLYEVRLLKDPTTHQILHKDAKTMEVGRVDDVYATDLVKAINSLLDGKEAWHSKPVEA